MVKLAFIFLLQSFSVSLAAPSHQQTPSPLSNSCVETEKAEATKPEPRVSKAMGIRASREK
jgi:hypothetical protein